MIHLSLIYTEFNALLLEDNFVSLLLIFGLKMYAFLLNIKYTLTEQCCDYAWSLTIDQSSKLTPRQESNEG